MNQQISPRIAQTLLTAFREFEKDSSLTQWKGLGRKEVLWTITALTGEDDLQKAISLLEKISQGALSWTVPPNLRELVELYEKREQLAETHSPQEVLQVQSAVIKAWIERLKSAPKPELPKVEVAERPPEFVVEPKQDVYVVKKTIPQPIVSTVVSQVVSLPVRPLKTLHALALEELKSEEAQNLFLLWQEGINAKKLKEAIKSLPKDSPTARAFEKRIASLDTYERSHPTISSFFGILHRSQTFQLSVFAGRQPSGVEVGKGRLLYFSVDTSKSQITSIARVPIQIGIRGLFSRTFSFLGKTGVVKAVTAPVKKVAAGILVRLGLTAAAGAVTGGIGAAVTWVLTTLGGKILGWLKDKLRGILPRDWGWVGLTIAFGLAALGIIFPAFAPFFFGAAALIGTASLLASFAGTVGAAFSGAAAGIGGLLSGITGAAGIGTAVIAGVIAGAVGIPAVLTAYTNLTYQSAFLEEAAAEAPGICLPPPSEAPPPAPSAPNTVFSWPVRLTPSCTSNFGYRTLNGMCNYHEGIDIETAGCGTDIFPIAEGEVLARNLSGSGPYGNYVVVQHSGFFSLYAHLSSVFVQPQKEVTLTTVLGESGNTGHSFGCHLHLSISSCGSVPGGCFVTAAPDPCSYLSSVYPGCSSDCGYKDNSICGDLPICR